MFYLISGKISPSTKINTISLRFIIKYNAYTLSFLIYNSFGIRIANKINSEYKNFNFVIEHSKTKWLKQATIYVKSSIFICKKQPIEKYKKKERAEIYSL